MKPLSAILNQFKSMYEAQRELSVRDSTLARLRDKGALVDTNGAIWIKSKTVLDPRVVKKLNAAISKESE